MKTNIFGDILDIQREMLRLITETPDAFNISQIVEDNWQPKCDIYRTDKQLHIALDISGVDKESIKIKSSQEYLTVSGERYIVKEEGEICYYKMEISSGAFERRIFFPNIRINYQQPAINYSDGVLKITYNIETEAENIIEINID